MFSWWANTIREAQAGYHTPVVQLHLRYGMILFIASEVMFFLAWFWAFFTSSLFPRAVDARRQRQWPPKGIEVLDPLGFPLLNTLILLCSGTTVTWAHHALIHGDREGLKLGLLLTILLGMLFTSIQAYEYIHAPFAFKGNIYGSTFFMATGFHGFHVLVGTIFLTVCLVRATRGDFTPQAAFRLRSGRLVLALRRRRLAVPVRLDLRLGRLGRADPRLRLSAPVSELRRWRRRLPGPARAAARKPCSRLGQLRPQVPWLRPRLRRLQRRRRSGGLPDPDRRRDPRRSARSRVELMFEPPFWVHLIWIPVGLGADRLRPARRQGGADRPGISPPRARRADCSHDPQAAADPDDHRRRGGRGDDRARLLANPQRAQRERGAARPLCGRRRRCRRSPSRPARSHSDQLPLFRHATGLCLKVVGMRATAGQNRAGEPGFAQIADCVTGAEGPGMSVELGWSKNPNAAVKWPGGLVSGIIAPDRKSRMRLVAASAPPGLEPSAPPSIDQIPNNHRAYAVQWFLFALIAAVIYVLAVRKRLQGSPRRDEADDSCQRPARGQPRDAGLRNGRGRALSPRAGRAASRRR